MAVTFWLYPAVSGQFWLYHWLPLLYFSMACVGLLATGHEGRPLSGLIGTAIMYGSAIVVAFPIVFGDIPHPRKEGVAGVERMAALLRERLRDGDTVQPMDWTSAGALHGLLLARARPATSFLYDFHFYHHVSTPYIKGLRQRFLDEMKTASPRFVVRGQAGPFPTGPDTSRHFPELDRLLEANYIPVLVDPSYVVYELGDP
jgi:hypothetical protein